jgi:hypothetical protein
VRSGFLSQGVSAPARVLALAGLLLALAALGCAASASAHVLGPNRPLGPDGVAAALRLRSPSVAERRHAPQRRPAAVQPRSLARGIHPPRRDAEPPPPAAAAAPAAAPAEAVSVAPAEVAPVAVAPAPQGPPSAPPAGKSGQEMPAEESPGSPAGEPESPAGEHPGEPPVEEKPPVEEPPAEEPPVEEKPPVEEPPVEEEQPPVEEPPGPRPLQEAGCESGLAGWNLSGVGEVVPTTVAGIAREGTHSCRIVLTGSQVRSELVFGGGGTASTTGGVQFREGDAYWYGFSFYIDRMVWGRPGAHNLIMQFKSDGQGSPAFGLDLWDVGGDRGLWSEGTATGGPNRFLAPLSEGVWYDVALHLVASSRGAGSYEVFLDGRLVDSRQNTSLIVPGEGLAYLKNGLYRNGGEIPGTSEIHLDGAKLGNSLASVSP